MKHIKEKFKEFLNQDEVQRNNLSSSKLSSVLNSLSPLQAMIANKENLTDEGIRSFLNLIGITDKTTQEDLLKNIDYLEYCNSLHEYIDVGNFFGEISRVLEQIVSQIKLNLENAYSQEEVDKIMKKHS